MMFPSRTLIWFQTFPAQPFGDIKSHGITGLDIENFVNGCCKGKMDQYSVLVKQKSAMIFSTEVLSGI